MKASRCSILVALAVAMLGLSALAWTALAQDAVAAPDTVIDIRVEGNERMSDDAVLSYVRSRLGQEYDEQVAREDQMRLLRTGRFDNVQVVEARTERGVVLTFAVSERPTVQGVQFRGNKELTDTDLRKLANLGPADPLDPARLETARAAIEQRYHDRSFYFASVEIDPVALRDQRLVIFDIVEGPRIRVRGIRFEGNDAFGAFRLRQQIRTSAAFLFFTRGKLDEQTLADDVVRLRSFHRDQGYLDAEVAARLDWSEDRTRVRPVFVIDEGPRYHVVGVEFRGNTIYADRELVDRLQMTAGEAYTALGLRRDVDAIRDAYGEIGFLNAEVEPRTRYPAPPETGPAAPAQVPAVVTLVYTITERDQYRVGRITIRGNTITQDRVIRRQLRFFPTQLYDTVAVEQSRQRLIESQLFNPEGVSITPYGDEPGFRNALVTVEEGQTGEFIVGVGVTSNNGLLGMISLGQRNFDATDWPDSWGEFFTARAFRGAGQTMRVTVEPGTELLRASVEWREPYLFDRPVSLGTRLYVYTRGRETYDETRLGAQVSLGKLQKNRWYTELATRLENVEVDELDDDAPPDVLRDAGSSNLVGFKGSLVRDRTDSRWRPTTGDRITLDYEQIVGDYTFGKAGASYQVYRTVYLDALDRPHVLAGRISGDHIVGGRAPVYERYYGGGIGSLRGFDYRGISPRQSDEVIGGDLYLYAGTEYTFPIYGDNLRGVLFLDSGTVEESCEITTWRVSAGFGLRLSVPIFGPVPMSLDFGFPINKADEDDTQMFSFSIGWVF